MDSDLTRRLADLQRYTDGLRTVVAAVDTETPQPSEGVDASGAVTVTVNGAGTVAAVRVRQGWQQCLGAREVADAVMQAFEAAVAAGMQRWSTALERAAWPSRVQRFEAGDGPAGSIRRDQAPEQPRPAGSARDPHEVTEDVLAVLSTVRTATAAAAPGAATGCDETGRVSITVSGTDGRLEACTVEPGWAARQDGHALTAALSAALRAAQAQVAGQNPDAQRGELDRLLADALAVLTNATSSHPGRDGR